MANDLTDPDCASSCTVIVLSTGATCVSAAFVAFAMQFLHVRWSLWGEASLAVISAIDCALLILMGQISHLITAYILYVIYRVFYKMMIVIAMFNIAKEITTENFGLVFGFNTFMALALQTLLTLIVVDQHGLALEPSNQFLAYGLYHGVVAVGFTVMAIATIWRHHCRKESVAIPEMEVAKQSHPLTLSSVN